MMRAASAIGGNLPTTNGRPINGRTTNGLQDTRKRRPRITSQERCTWCDKPVQQGDGYRLGEHAGDRGAVFCRLEHIVPWAIQGARWDAGEPKEPQAAVGTESPGFCSHCDRRLGEDYLLLVRHRGEHRIADRFCSVDHLLDWAKAGGSWRARPQ
jgi:hypothetical protein